MSTTISTRRRRIGSVLASTVLVASAFALSGAQPASAAPVTVKYRLSGTMAIAGTELPLPDNATWTGRVDRAKGTITNGKSTIPDIVIPPTESLPVAVTVRISDAAASTGTVNSKGVVTLNVRYKAELIGLGCTINPIAVSLSSAGGVNLDKGNSFAILAATGFNVPAMPVTDACSSAIADPANATLGLPTTDTAIQLTLQGPPAAPKGAAAPGKRQITFGWKPGANPGGEPVTGYSIRYRVGKGKWKNGGNVSANAKSKRFTKLKPGTAYTFQVRATNAVGVGAWSVPVSAKPRR
jgi:hypothetical protein